MVFSAGVTEPIVPTVFVRQNTPHAIEAHVISFVVGTLRHRVQRMLLPAIRTAPIMFLADGYMTAGTADTVPTVATFAVP